MNWYKDRDYPELKRECDDGQNELLAVIPNVKQLDAVIKAHTDELKELLNLAEEWKDAYNRETKRLKIENVQLKQTIEELEKESRPQNEVIECDHEWQHAGGSRWCNKCGRGV